LAVNSQNTSNTNTLSGHVALDSNLTITQAAGGTLAITQAFSDPGTFKTGTDIKGNTLTLAGSGSTSLINLSGDIYNSTGSGKVVVGGTGTVAFSGTNTYGGTTTVSGGTLLVNGNQSTAAGAVSVSGTLGGIGTIGGATTVNNNGKITGGTNGGIGTLSFNNVGLTIATGGTYVVDTGGTSSADRLALGSGILDLSASGDILSFNTPITPLTGTSYTLATFASHNGIFDSVLNTPAGYQVDYTGTSILLDQITAVPEPGTWIGGALVAASLLTTQRRRLFALVRNC
jgi:autotransporter-associated beta strand protein